MVSVKITILFAALFDRHLRSASWLSSLSWEVLEVSLHLELHLTARVRIGLEASLREVKDGATLSELPSVLATALKQWFAEVVDVSS
jgi:hypothetical protein